MQVHTVLSKREGNFPLGLLDPLFPSAREFTSPSPSFLPAPLRKLLKAKGINRLYSHQAHSLREVEADKNIVVVTPTASGKTLCYNLPVLKTLLENTEARALYLFPTKALARDRVAELALWSEKLGAIKTYTCDGDAPGDTRGDPASRETS